MKSAAFRQAIRKYELEQVLSLMPPNSTILEIGAGAGWQAKLLAERGFQVEAIDIGSSRYKAQQVWPVLEYDGKHIPFPDHVFDAVFSSNTLEHIPHVATFVDEIRRVLKPGGIAVHLMPSATWRFWTICTHYPFFPHHLKKAVRSFNSRTSSTGVGKTRLLLDAMYDVLIPSRHGERGNVLTELYLFSRFAWLSLFHRTGWRVKACFTNRLFYTGHGLFGALLGLRSRRFMSHLLGSACNIFVLAPLSKNEAAVSHLGKHRPELSVLNEQLYSK